MFNALEKLQARFERKFVFENKPVTLVEQMVQMHPANFHEIYHKRHINNIYFDTIRLRNFNDNYEGNGERKKVRIRWYGNTFGKATSPFLEFKIKKGELGYKRSYALPDFNIGEGFGNADIQALFQEANLPNRIREELKGLEARLLNTYCRRYFRSFDTHFRFTIDDDLNYFYIRPNANNFLAKRTDFETVILELKYDDKHAAQANLISGCLPIRVSKYSKYMAGMEKLYPAFV